MRSMSRVERFFERLVERPSARLFRTRLQPIQVLRRIERAMEAGRVRHDGHDSAPNVFEVRLSPTDLMALGRLDTVAADLASGALAFARSKKLVLIDRPRVSIRPQAALARGQIEVDARVGELGQDVAPLDAGTRVFEIPGPRAPEASLAVREPGRLSRRVRFDGPILIGRAPDCDLSLRDTRASRHHARIHARDGVLVLTDLDSTNGTRVNGQRIREVVLGHGDRILIGESELIVGGSDDGETDGLGR